MRKRGKDVTEYCTRFKKVDYDDLKAKQKELFNFQKIAATLADYGFNCIKLADDWQGADFLAYHIDGTTTLKVQLKSRVTIDQKYLGKGLWIAFPHGGFWYLIEHDCLVEKIGKHTAWLRSDSWTNSQTNSKREFGGYSSTSINSGLLESLREDRIGAVYGAVFLDDKETVDPAP
jgi:hypothetical protein